MRRHAKRVGIFVVGWALIIAGLAGIVLPILPGWVLIFLGLALLAQEFEWAERRQDQLKAYYHRKKAQMIRSHRERVEDRHAGDAADVREDESDAAIVTAEDLPPILARPGARDNSPFER